ncbi:CLE25p like [Actinidia chinensis var. chinensis]|uniref:CLE25p like n=1 Tax=Actinidia chinensis var. chinensis TaxID=1590841 RepID=A0A2R6P9D3_ACTCC|nr:CLE25p like [Actinidia chinensis var. chinensis]
MGGRGRFLRASQGAVLLMGFFWFLFIGVVASRAMRTTTITIMPTVKSSELLKLIGTQRHAVHRWDLDPNYVSKRRVPNGPDPIHNRRAGKSREPPGRI